MLCYLLNRKYKEVAVSEKVKGSCLCGAARFEVAGGFDSFFLCYCNYCQKDTGSAYASNLFSRSAILTWLKGQSEVSTYQLPGTRHTKSFCRICGSALPVYSEELKLLTVPAGSLDSSVPIYPCAKIFLSSEADWGKRINTLPCFNGLPS